jgi:hypothetical protein
MAGRHFMFRRGRRGAAVMLGLYGWDGTGLPTLLGDTYDARNGKSGSYIPGQYSANYRHQAYPANDYVPLFSVAPGVGSPPAEGRYAFYFRQQPFLNGLPTDTEPTARWLFTSDGASAPVAVATNAGIQSADLFGLLATSTTYYALAGGAVPRVWTSTNGTLWTQGSVLSGYFAHPIEGGSTLRMFEFGGDFYALGAGGLARNSANDGVSWSPVPLLDGSIYDIRAYNDVAWDDTAIVIICQGRKISDAQFYNVILRSTDGVTFTEVRNQLASTDFVTATAVPLEWRNVIPFGTGFCAYGAHEPTGAFPNVLKSTDHGATWAAAAKVNPLQDNAGQNAIQNLSGYPGATKVVAVIPIYPSGTPPPRQVLHSSDDGITFSTLSF